MPSLQGSFKVWDTPNHRALHELCDVFGAANARSRGQVDRVGGGHLPGSEILIIPLNSNIMHVDRILLKHNYIKTIKFETFWQSSLLWKMNPFLCFFRLLSLVTDFLQFLPILEAQCVFSPSVLFCFNLLHSSC